MKLSKKIFLIFFISVGTTLILGLFSAFYFGSTGVRKMVEEKQLESTTQLMDSIDRTMYERYMDIETIAGLVIFQDIVVDRVDTGLIKDANYLLKKLLSTSGPWNSLYVLDKEGGVVVSSESATTENLLLNSEIKKAFEAAIGGNTYYSDVVSVSNEKTIIFSSPIVDRNQFGKPIEGVAMGFYSWPVIEEIIENIKDREVFLINSHGEGIYNNGKNGENIETHNHQSHPTFRQAMKVKKGVIEALSFHSKTSVLSAFVVQKGYLQYAGSGWILFQEIPMNQIFLSVLKVVIPIVLIFFVVIIVLPLILYLLVKNKVIMPIDGLIKIVKSYQAGNLDLRVKIVSKDEIGELGEAFNDMANRMSEIYTGLERKIKERTENLDRNIELLKEKNEALDKNKSAMLNILEDDRLLEEALKTEKANVEKKVEERTLELSRTKARLDSSIQNLPVGFLMIDIFGKLVVSNSLANKILGGDENKNIEKLREILKDKVDVEKYIKDCGHTSSNLKFDDIEMGGKYYQLLLSPIMAKEIAESCIGIVVLIQDITEAKILERSKDEFFSIASHELRTPLTAIRGNTSMILEYYAEAIKEPELRAMVDDIHESSIRLINIVNDFLNVSRLEQKRMEFDIKEFDLGEIIRETLKEYDVTGSRKKLSMDYDEGERKLPKVLGDVDKVRQVLINLVGNSLKFTEKGGVTISTEILDKKIKVLVTDTGRGISLKQQNLLFHKFQQAGTSLFTRDTAGGSGLGLYISKMMLEGMGGEINLEKSEEGKGSTFSFTVPKA